jgi:hypothetical protein
MNIQALGDVFELVGELTIAYTVIAVHHRIILEKKMDKKVLNIMKKEQALAVLGMTLIILGFIIKHGTF